MNRWKLAVAIGALLLMLVLTVLAVSYFSPSQQKDAPMQIEPKVIVA
ncbi:hypothetical protein BH23ACT11_BH23ACT11_12680 [soil metagenome]